jgi:fructokinase
MQKFTGIEAGGTKFICAIGDSAGKIIERARIPTTTAQETITNVIDWLKAVSRKNPFEAIGVASFGPIEIDTNSPLYGHILATHKPGGWGKFDIVGELKKAFNMPVAFDTDVNGAALGEYRWGSGKGLQHITYWTVGTGIGAGIILAGKIMQGVTHPETGHAFIPHNKERDSFPGMCQHHSDCLEGLASGPAMMKRWNVASAIDLPTGHEAWDIEAEYISYAMANCIMTFTPQKIILGGGVMQHEELYPKIRKKTLELLADYIQYEGLPENLDDFIVAPGLGNDSGVLGAIALAEQTSKDAG